MRDSIRNELTPTVEPIPPDTPVHEKEYPAEGVNKPGVGATVGTSQFRMESLKADRIEAEMAFDNKVIASDLGWFWDSIVA